MPRSSTLGRLSTKGYRPEIKTHLLNQEASLREVVEGLITERGDEALRQQWCHPFAHPSASSVACDDHYAAQPYIQGTFYGNGSRSRPEGEGIHAEPW
jgi:hypothetical protein